MQPLRRVTIKHRGFEVRVLINDRGNEAFIRSFTVYTLYHVEMSHIFEHWERLHLRNSLTFVKFYSNLDGRLCWDLNPGARDVVDKHLSTRPRSLTIGYS